jgi:hypothetical protein
MEEEGRSEVLSLQRLKKGKGRKRVGEDGEILSGGAGLQDHGDGL